MTWFGKIGFDCYGNALDLLRQGEPSGEPQTASGDARVTASVVTAGHGFVPILPGVLRMLKS